jgi:toxin-antitoxin system PIN domain toxin
MLVPDVNVFMNLMNEASEHHAAALAWTTAAANMDEPVGVPELVLSSVIRISTGAKMGDTRRTPEEAFRFCAALSEMPAYVRLVPGARHWATFRGCVLGAGISGPAVSDAYLAAFAIENDATFVTFDRGFTRFPQLRVQILRTLAP